MGCVNTGAGTPARRGTIRRPGLLAAVGLVAASMGAHSYADAGKGGVKHPKVGAYRGEITQVAPPFTGEATLEVDKPRHKGGKSFADNPTVTVVPSCTEASGESSSVGQVEFPSYRKYKITDKGAFFFYDTNTTIFPGGGTEKTTLEIRGRFVRKRVAKGWAEIGYTQNWHPALPCYERPATSGRVPFTLTAG